MTPGHGLQRAGQTIDANTLQRARVRVDSAKKTCPSLPARTAYSGVYGDSERDVFWLSRRGSPGRHTCNNACRHPRPPDVVPDQFAVAPWQIHVLMS